ncbi:ABC transporter permease [Shewanella amazonensis]|uniref:ABC transporter, permease, putative n=1 Tax=Shewanella amazonensis (strain ATCC BAA-1098 / SB2B) TaxID=326297 RepID=A1S5N8_SHEAM|nr:FtsX-like permease family protein [Shewanella amazonensis]ABL99694.1 ABC transporter, permease, putative [Shewanella amazonensis SB2B]
MLKSLALRLFWRELRQGQLLLILFAISLAVLAVTGLARVSERLQVAISGEAAKFTAADRVVDSPQPLSTELLARIDAIGLARADSMLFNSMAWSGDAFQLVTVRAVGNSYPLKGEIELADGPTGLLPEAGTLWYEGRLAGLIGQSESLELGDRQFNLTKEIKRLPDAGFNPFASSPVVLMGLDDVASTGIVGPGSRVTYLYQFSGDSAQLAELDELLKAELTSSQRLRDVKSGDSPIASAVARAERFLLLASLLGIALACAAIGIAAQRYCQRHYDVVAMFKTFGASAKEIRTLFALHLSLVTAFGVLVGILGGLGLDAVIARFLPPELTAYEAPLLRPVLLGVLTGSISALMFSAYPLLRLLAIPPLRVLQRELTGRSAGVWLHAALSLSAMALLGYAYSRSWQLTGAVVLGALLLGLILFALGFVMIRLGHGAGLKTTNPLQLALAGLRRRAAQNSVQLVGFSTALVLLLTIFALRQDLLDDWQKQLPEGAPNFFLVNISPEDEAPMAEFLAENHIERTDIYPVIRGRLSAINGEALISERQSEEGATGRVGIGRELNMTWRDSLPPNNRLIAGEFDNVADGVSVETKVAERLGLKLGDSLSFVIDNQTLDVRVTSLREVRWETMQPNFFMIFSKEALAPFAYTSMLSFHLDEAKRPLVVSLIKQFPTVSVIDVGAMVAQLRSIVSQVSLALGVVLALVIASSSLVLWAQTEAGMSVRRRELAVLRTFGAGGRLLRLATTLEFAVLGAVAGIVAVVVTEAVLYLLKTWVFELGVNWHLQWWLQAPLLGAALVAVLGYWRCRELLSQSCLSLLRTET